MDNKQTLKQKTISMGKYNQIMADIIKKGHPVSDTLVEMLEEAAKYKIRGPKKNARKHNHR